MLYLCSTPIGNLEDITLRVLRILREADSVWAEDTRRTLNLLNHYNIKKPLVSYHEHNIREREAQFTNLMRENKVVAYCSDAGMPGISDPGRSLVSLCVRNDFPVTVLPGASAVLLSAVLSGLDCSAFMFTGFLPREKKRRAAAIENIRKNTSATIIFESPLRVAATLNDLKSALGPDRECALCRELTKLHEEAVRGTIFELCAHFCEPPKGECVIVIGGAEPEENEPADIEKAIKKLLNAGFSPKDAALSVSLTLNAKKNEAYKLAIMLASNEAL